MERAVVRIVEGESTVPGECTPLGTCAIGLPPFLPKGSLVEILYKYNDNQVLEVAVQACGKKTEVAIDRLSGMLPGEVDNARARLAELNVS